MSLGKGQRDPGAARTDCTVPDAITSREAGTREGGGLLDRGVNATSRRDSTRASFATRAPHPRQFAQWSHYCHGGEVTGFVRFDGSRSPAARRAAYHPAY